MPGNRRGAPGLLRGPFGGRYGVPPALWFGRRGSRTRRNEGNSFGGQGGSEGDTWDITKNYVDEFGEPARVAWSAVRIVR